ncbi:hypothetical protein [Ktedonospora formicarum]|uniref:Uncharacterized protein n=1 Tax=Ktedonospora formicarum TaxID=2778364 RepID=A0A8J3I447_9CHLR|nr:hypothetical protein [Ktedonospora formicarum]GHO44514.1 hypothetical protein KSX_26770 [Ktedonospora formicarum]
MEAERLAIYFEEIGAYQQKQLKEQNSAAPSSSGSRETVEIEIGDDE